MVRAEHIPGVFFTGWRGHDELPTGLGCAASTYEVAVLQLAQLIAEDRQVRPCANERWTRLFTRQRGRAKYDKTGHSTGVLYCSAQCAKAQAERSRRARLRAEGVAGRLTPEN